LTGAAESTVAGGVVGVGFSVAVFMVTPTLTERLR
jgi:hypothetical protein